MTTTDHFPDVKKVVSPVRPQVRLGDVCALVNGDAYKETDWATSGIPIIRIQNLNDPSKPFNYWRGSLADRVVVSNGDLLLAWSGTPGTSFGAHIWNRGQGVLNQHIFRVDIDADRIDREYAKLAINQQLDAMIAQAHGAVGLRHITKGETQGLLIPLPPLAEQRRIAARLSEQIAHVARARAAAEERLNEARRLEDVWMRRSLATLPTTATVVGEVIERIEAGRSPRCEERPAREGEWGVLKVSAVSWKQFRPHENKVLPASFRVLPEYMVRRGDLLISRSNTRELVGATVLVRNDADRLMLSDKTLRLVPRPDRAVAEYLEVALRSKKARDFIEERATGASHSMRNISQGTIGQIPIDVPPVSDQSRIIDRLRLVSESASAIVSAAQRELGMINAFPAALLRQTFGEHPAAN